MGNSLSRDSFDTELVKAFRNGEGKLINQTFEALGWYKGPTENTTGWKYAEQIKTMYPNRAGYKAYIDTDSDGMSDDWEEAVGLDKNNAEDGPASYAGSEYTNLDVFLRFLVENPEAAIAH